MTSALIIIGPYLYFCYEAIAEKVRDNPNIVLFGDGEAVDKIIKVLLAKLKVR